MFVLRFLRPPIYEDEEDTRLTHALHNIQLSLLGTALLVLPIVILIRETGSAWGLVGGLVILLFTIWLNHHGYVQVSSLLLVLLVLGVANFLVWSGQGIHDITSLVYALVLIIAGLLLGRKQYFIVLCLVILSVNFIIFAEINGWLSTTFGQLTDYSDMWIVSAILIAVGTTMRLLSDNLMNNLAKIRQIAGQQAHLILETRDQAEQLRILNRISLAMASGLDLEQVLIELYQQLKMSSLWTHSMLPWSIMKHT